MTNKPNVQAGYYAEKQIHCVDPVISWSHRARFARAQKLFPRGRDLKVLDYGCGDGSLLSHLAPEYAELVGTEVDDNIVKNCRERLAPFSNLKFVPVRELARFPQGHFDVISCTEVMEHLLWDKLEEVESLFYRLLKPGGTLIISVPVEAGPSLLIKECFRTVAGWRRLGDYAHKEKYSFAELLKMGSLMPSWNIQRPVYQNNYGPYHGHKGFDWRRVRTLLTKRFRLKLVSSSPLGFAPWFVNSQVWLVLEKPL